VGQDTFLIAIAMIFIIPFAVWRIFRLEHYAPLAVVQIVIGIVLGPGALGALMPEYYGFVFNGRTTAVLADLAAWAVMLFVWTAGLELDVDQAWRSRKETAVTAILALLVPLALGSLVALALVTVPGWTGERAEAWQAVLGIGMAAAVTSLPVLLVFMERLDIMGRPIGQRVLRYASLDDIAIWGVLALIMVDWARLGLQAGFLAGFLAAALAMRWVMPRLGRQDRWYVGLAWLVLSSMASDYAGLHFMVGAFLSGAILDSAWFGEEQVRAFRRHVLLALMPIFFLSTGLRTSWEAGGLMVAVAAAALLAAAIVGKLAGVALAGRILKWSRLEGSVIGWLLQTKGLMMIVFAAVLLDKQIITGGAFTALLLMGVVSTALTIPIVAPKLERLLGTPEGRPEPAA
jgi:Kef-type K+ transport system membrane component KefB